MIIISIYRRNLDFAKGLIVLAIGNCAFKIHFIIRGKSFFWKSNSTNNLGDEWRFEGESVMRICLIFLIIIAVQVVGVSSAFALPKDYYVDSDKGVDTDCGNIDNPWKTIYKVNHYRGFHPGDQVLFKRGEVWRETLVIPISGDSSSLFQVDWYGSDPNKPVISGADVVSGFVKVSGQSSANIFTDPSFEDWDEDQLNPNHWTTINNGNSKVCKSLNHKYGTYGVQCVMGDANIDIGVKRTEINLTPNTNYRLGLHHHELEAIKNTISKIKVYIIHQTLPHKEYWNPQNSDWVTGKTAAIECHDPEWMFKYSDFISDSGIEKYTIEFVMDGADSITHEELYFDYVSLFEAETEDIYYAPLIKNPKYVYVSGVIGGQTVDHLQLTNDTDNITNPHIYCYGYDEVNRNLYINIGDDPSNLTVECSVRENNIKFNGESYVEVSNIKCTKAYGSGIDLGYDDIRPTNLIVSQCRSEYSGQLGILAGHRPDNSTFGASGSGDGSTPANITIEFCEVYKYARSGKIRIPHGIKTWFNGYIVPNSGIRIFRGTDTHSGSDVGKILIQGNIIDGGLPPINYSTGRNGIHVTMGNDVEIKYNNLTRTDHAIVVFGIWQSYNAGDVQKFEILNNTCHDTGDDGIYIFGNKYGGSIIADNIIQNNQDNGIDLQNCTGMIEITGNTIESCVNESIAIWGSLGTNAKVYDNLIRDWGAIWRDKNPGLRLGCAIGIDVESNLTNAEIYLNTYYQEVSAPTANTPFHQARIPKTFSEWQSLGYDLNSTIIYYQNNN